MNLKNSLLSLEILCFRWQFIKKKTILHICKITFEHLAKIDPLTFLKPLDEDKTKTVRYQDILWVSNSLSFPGAATLSKEDIASSLLPWAATVLEVCPSQNDWEWRPPLWKHQDIIVWLGRTCGLTIPGSHISVSHSTSESPCALVLNNTICGTSKVHAVHIELCHTQASSF